MTTYGLDREKLAKLRPFLQADERVLWSGQPPAGCTVTKSDYFLIPWGLFWIAISSVGLFVPAAKGSQEMPPLFKLVGILMFVMALYILIGRLIFRWWRNKRTIYAVTDRNIVVLTQYPGTTSFRAGSIEGLSEVQLDAGRRDRGTIKFGPSPNNARWLENSGLEFVRGGNRLPMAFYDIPDVRRVHDLIIHQRDELSRNKAQLAAR